MEKGSEKNAENDIELSETELRTKEKHGEGGGGEEEFMTTERIFEHKEVPSWKKRLTVRASAVSFMLSVMFSFIVMKLNLTTGIIPSLNISAGLLGFFFVKTWTKLLDKSGMLKQPFTRQENTVIQTCVVASSGVTFSDTSLLLFSSLPRIFFLRCVRRSAPGLTSLLSQNF